MPRDLQPIRIYRMASARPQWVLDDGSGLFDLSDYWRQRGRSDDVLELASDGWFTPSQLEEKLPRNQADGLGIWKPFEARADGLPAGSLAVPIPRPLVGKILALGKNFQAHAAEFQEEVPAEPMFFNKLPETLLAHDQSVRVPSWYTQRVDHEVELAVLVGLEGRDIAEEDALEHVAFYTLANDLTARSMQGWDRKRSFPWFRAKNMDGFCPLGPALVPAGYLDPNAVELRAEVNGEVRQRAHTETMIVSIPAAIAYLSKHLTLRPGDLILMGTPAGVGALEDGDTVTCFATSIGALSTHIQRPKA